MAGHYLYFPRADSTFAAGWTFFYPSVTAASTTTLIDSTLLLWWRRCPIHLFNPSNFYAELSCYLWRARCEWERVTWYRACPHHESQPAVREKNGQGLKFKKRGDLDGNGSEGNDVDVVPVALGTKKGSFGGNKESGGGGGLTHLRQLSRTGHWTDTKRLINFAQE